MIMTKINRSPLYIDAENWTTDLAAILGNENYHILVWCSHGQYCGTYNGAFTLEKEAFAHTQSILMYNDSKEIKLDNNEGKLSGRAISEENGTEQVHAIDEDVLIWGDYAKPTAYGSLLSTTRGMQLKLPEVFEINKGENNTKIVAKVKNYIGSEGLATYIDQRLIGFEKKNL